MNISPLQQLIDRLKNLEDYENTTAGRIAYKYAIAAAESLLDEEERFIKRAKEKYHEEIISNNTIVNNNQSTNTH